MKANGLLEFFPGKMKQEPDKNPLKATNLIKNGPNCFSNVNPCEKMCCQLCFHRELSF